jgi:tetratricopeptide (TPR) repeat protein
MRATRLKKNRKLEDAAALLKPHVHTYPLAATERFRIDLELNHREQAVHDAREVSAHMQQTIQDGNSISSYEYETWAAAEQLLGNNSESHEILREWLKHYPTDEAARRSVAALSLQEFDRILNSASANPQELAARLSAAFTLSDATDNMKRRVAILYQQRGAHPPLGGLFDLLAQLPDLPPSLAETVGTSAAASGDWDQARVYLEQAVRKDATNSTAWNNLACAMLQKKEPPLEEAFAAVSKALELEPDDFRFRETRGEILLQLGRWQEAVTDLEYAINGLPNTPAIHRRLAKAYELLGNRELAAFHLQNAN